VQQLIPGQPQPRQLSQAYAAQLAQLAHSFGGTAPGYLQWLALAHACTLNPGTCTTGLQDLAYSSAAQAQNTYQLATAAYEHRTDTGGATSLPIAIILALTAAAAPEILGLAAPEATTAGADAAAEDAGTSTAERIAASCGGMSFGAGTKVLLASGAAIPIASLKPGDKVLATNTKTGKTSAEPVTAVLVHHDTNRFNLTVTTASGTSVIDTTASHLFFDHATGKWTEAADLVPGSQLETPHGIRAVVTDGATPRSTVGEMWDLTVDNDHDFYVSTPAADVLVHNCGPEEENPYVKGMPQQDPPRSTWESGTSEPNMSGSDMPSTETPAPQTPMQKIIFTLTRLAEILHNLGQG
jgi:Pretoxin HINT domain